MVDPLPLEAEQVVVWLEAAEGWSELELAWKDVRGTSRTSTLRVEVGEELQVRLD